MERITTPEYKALYLETTAELEVKKNDLMSCGLLLRSTQDDLQKARELTRAIATQRDLW